MSFTIIVLFFVLFPQFFVIGLGVHFYQNYSQNKPSFGRMSLLVLQVLLLGLFFTDALTSFNEVVFDVLWWGLVGIGLMVGVFGMKHQAILSVLHILLSLFSGILMLFILFITSM